MPTFVLVSPIRYEHDVLSRLDATSLCLISVLDICLALPYEVHRLLLQVNGFGTVFVRNYILWATMGSNQSNSRLKGDLNGSLDLCFESRESGFLGINIPSRK